MVDPGEKERLFEETVAQNMHWLRIMAKNNASADNWQDLEQEILIALWRSLDRFSSRSSLETWLYSLARNTAKDFKRRNHNVRERDRRVYPNPGFVEQNHDEMRIVADFIETLNALDRQLFIMYLDDTGYAEMSSATGIDEANLRKRMSRMKEQFKTWYNGSRSWI